MFKITDINLTKRSPLSYVKVDPLNLPQALQLQHQVWPDNPVDPDYIAKVDFPDDTANVSWLVYHRNTLVGLIGVFTFDPDEPGYDNEESIWGDWLAITPQYRNQGIGRQVLLDTISYAKSLNRFKYFRFDTSDYPGRASTKLYDQVMELQEDYTAEPMPPGHRGLIYSCSLDGSPVRPWNNRFLDLNSCGAIENTVN